MDDNKNTVLLKKIIDEFKLEVVYGPEDLEELRVCCADITRPGLPLAGFFDHFDPDRMEILGNMEHIFLSRLSSEERKARITELFSHHPVAVVIARGLPVHEEMLELAKDFNIPILSTPQTTSAFVAALIASLNLSLAPRVTRHGVLVEVYGEGILMLGDSGVGKSETAIELIKRGHRLIADDAVEIKRVSAKTLVGTAPEIIRHYVELRGIGIIDVRRIFGMGAVKESEKIDLVLNMEQWVEGKMYDRFGLDSETINILGNEIPAITIPVRPGRNLAVIVEIAAMNNRLKKTGYNTAEEFNKKLMAQLQ